MLNSAWPSLYWQMYDWYLVPTSGFWSVRKGCAPQQLIYNYGDNHIYAVNDEKEDVELKANLKAYGLDGKLLCDASATADMPMGSSVKLFEVLPKGEDINDVMFLFLTLTDKKGNIVSKNEYVIAEVMDKHDWNKYRWWRTQLESYADFSALDDLAPAEVVVSVSKESTERGAMPSVTIENKSDVVAFFVRMDIKYGNGEIFPALWSDNLVTLQPGETLTVNTGTMIIDGIDAELVISGWNVAEQVIIL